MTPAEKLQERVMERLDMSRDVEDQELTELIHKILLEHGQREYMPLTEKIRLGRELFYAFRKLDLLQELLEDEDVTEIMINGATDIFVEKDGELTKLERKFVSVKKLEDVIQQIVGGVNRVVNEVSPIVDARLPDGSRVNIVLPPIALNGPIVTVRRFPKERVTMERLLQWKAIGREEAQFLKRLVKARYNILISGGTGSGKTTFLNALSEFIPQEQRVITIEDSAELQLQHIPNLVRLETRNANVEGMGEITMAQLIRTALRMRPDRIIVGEVRSGEAIDMLQAMNTGHDGSFSTGHANSPQDMMSRLETMVLAGAKLPLPAIQRQIAAGIDILVHLGRLRDRSRRVLEITEVMGFRDGEIRLKPLYRFEAGEMRQGRLEGGMRKLEHLTHREKLLAAGYTD